MNRELEESNRKIRSEMESGHEEMEKMADEYEKMKKVIGVTDHFTDDLHKQNAQLKIQVRVPCCILFRVSSFTHGSH